MAPAVAGRIAFFDTRPYDREPFEGANARFGFGIDYHEAHLTEATAHLARGCDAACVFVNDRVTRAVADALVAEGVRLVALRCAGYNNVDLRAVWRRLHVVRVPAYSPHAVAEHAVALMLTLNRKTHRAYTRTRDNNFSLSGLVGFDMRGKTAGVVGTGRIGLVVAGILRGFGMEVLAHDVRPEPAAAREHGLAYVDLDTLLERSDIVTLHCHLTPETRHLIDRAAIARMKEGVMIVNTGRGALIDTRALIAGLKSGRVGAAGLDVYEEEGEYFFEDLSGEVIRDDVLERLLTFPNVLVTAHQGFLTREALAAIAETALGNVRDFLAGGPLPNEVCYRCGQRTCRKKAKGRCF